MRGRVVVIAIAGVVVAGAAAWAVVRLRSPRTIALPEGRSFELGEEQTATVGDLTLTLHGPSAAFALEARDGRDTFQPSVDRGARFKMGAHLVDAKHADGAERVAVTVSAWRPATPLAAADVETLAEEAARSRCGDEGAKCRARLDTPGGPWSASCTCEGSSDKEEEVTVDAKSGAVLARRQRGGV
jgi:hypothetical protein